MENKFTKSPWLVRENDFIGDKLEIWHNDYSGVEQIPIASVEIGLNPLFDAEQRANANLIAASPDLYSALDEIVSNAEQVVFEAWLERYSPSGDSESVQWQWSQCSDYVDFINEWRPAINALDKSRGEPC